MKANAVPPALLEAVIGGRVGLEKPAYDKAGSQVPVAVAGLGDLVPSRVEQLAWRPATVTTSYWVRWDWVRWVRPDTLPFSVPTPTSSAA